MDSPEMKKLRALAQHYAVKEDGCLFRTGVPVTFRYLRTKQAAPFMGELYQQHIEPAGRYLLHNEDPGDRGNLWVMGNVSFHNPLVVPFNTEPFAGYNGTSWKALLHAAYGKTGKELSMALVNDGYDAVVTACLGPDGVAYGTFEMVSLAKFATGREIQQ